MITQTHAQEGVYMTTHLNENLAEIALAKQIHECDTYLGIYDKVLFVSLFILLFSKRDLTLKRSFLKET